MSVPRQKLSKKIITTTTKKSKQSYYSLKKKGALGLLRDFQTLKNNLNTDYYKASQMVKDINPLKPTAFVFNVAQWKQEYVKQFLPEYRLIYLPLNVDLMRYDQLVNFLPNIYFIMWGRKVPENITAYAAENDITVYHIEDGFIRSVGLGADKVAPVSLCIDTTGFYYDSSVPSDLENILNNYDFDTNPDLMKQAQEAIDFIKENKINKYNHTQNNIAESLYGVKTRKRVLVLGQVEDDQSVLFGCEDIITNLELIKIAIKENPDAQVIFKPHPDVLKGKRREISDSLKADIDVEIYHTNMSMFDALTGVDRVYTITSLGGFESLINGVPVTTLGAPFYSGWGLTDDRQIVSRRKRNLSLLEVFAAAYILYPRYRINETRTKADLYTSLEYLDNIIKQGVNSQLFDSQQTRKIYNMATTHPLDLLYHKKSSSQKLAIISDSSDSMEFACNLSVENKKTVDIFYYDRVNELSEEIVVPLNFVDSINLFSFDDESATQRFKNHNVNGNEFLHTVSSSIRYTLSTIVDDKLVMPSYLQILSSGIEPYIFELDKLYNAAKNIIQEYDMVVVFADDLNTINDLFYLLWHHAKILDLEGKINIAFKNQKQGRELARSGAIPKPKTVSPVEYDVLEEKASFSKFWYDVILNPVLNVNYEQDLMLVSSVSDSEAVALNKRVMNSVSELGKTATLLLSGDSILDEKGSYDVFKTTMPIGCNIFNQQINDCKLRYPSFYKYRPQFIDYFTNTLLQNLKTKLPDILLHMMELPIKQYSKILFNNMFLLASIQRFLDMDKAVLCLEAQSIEAKLIYQTCVDNNHPAGIIQSAKGADMSAVIHSGLNPSIVWIDTNERDRYGLSRNKQIMGLTSLREDLLFYKSLDKASSEYQKKSIMFLTDGLSNPRSIDIAKDMAVVAKRNKCSVILAVDKKFKRNLINRLRSCFDATIDVKIVGKNEPTEKYLYCSNLVVGMCTADLYKASLGGFATLCLYPIDEHRDQLKDIAIICEDISKVQSYMEDALTESKSFKQYVSAKNKFIKNNAPYAKPHDEGELESFIKGIVYEIKDN